MFHGIFVGIPHNQKGFRSYLQSTRNIIFSYYVVFDESLSSVLAYRSQPYSEAISMRPSVIYIPYAISSKEKTDNIITFAHLKRGVYYLKIVMMWKAVTNQMTIQLCHHYLAKKKWMLLTLEMSQMIVLCLRRC